jgi:O-antigen ligase
MHNADQGMATRGRVLANARFLARKESMIPLSLLLFYLFMEYARPQVLLPFLGLLHLSGILIVLLGLSILSSGKIQLKEKQTTLFMFLLGLMVVHGPIAVNNYWTLMIFISMMMNFIVYLSLIHFVDRPENFDRLLKAWIGIHVFVAIVGIARGGRGTGGFLGDENDLCMTLNMIIPFTFFLSFNETRKKKAIYLVLTCLFLFVIILTQSRGGFVGLTATCLYCWFRSKRKILTAFILGILALFAVVMAPPTYWGEVRSITEEGVSKGTGAERFYTWGIGWHMFLDHPIMGVGQGNFPYVFKKYEFEVTGSDEPFRGRSVAGRAAHSIYVTLLSELGIIGTILFLLISYTSIKDLNYIKKGTHKQDTKKPKEKEVKQYNLALALEGSLVAYLVSGAFISTLYYPNFWILIGFILSFKNIVIHGIEQAPALNINKIT